MTSLTRKDLLRGAAASAVVVGWDPVARGWAAAARPGRRLDAVPALDGVLLTDPVSKRLAADDYGNVVHHEPAAVLRPVSVDDVVKIVRYAGERGIRVSMRGQAHCGYGQAQAPGGIVIDSATLCRIHAIGDDRAVVDPGVMWRTLLAAAVARGVTPPALTDYQGLSIGGVLSIGGIDSGPMKHGLIVDNVLELQVVTGTGDLVTCSPERHRRLFRAVLGGIGQFAVIVRATLRMIPAPATALMFRLRYDDLDASLADMAAFARDGRFNSFEQFAAVENGRWVFNFQGAAYFDPPHLPDVTALLRGVHDVPARRVIAPVPYLAWTLRLDPLVPLQVASRLLLFNGLLPESTGPGFIRDVFARTPQDLGDRGPLFVMGNTTRSQASKPALPVSDVYFGLLLFRAAGDAGVTAARLADNRRMYDRMVGLGGKRYPWDAIPDLTRADWKRHFGDEWPQFLADKKKFDPIGILGVGQGIFA